MNLRPLVIAVNQNKLLSEALHLFRDQISIVANEDRSIQIALADPISATLPRTDAFDKNVIPKRGSFIFCAADNLAVEGIVPKKQACTGIFFCNRQQ